MDPEREASLCPGILGSDHDGKQMDISHSRVGPAEGRPTERKVASRGTEDSGHYLNF